MKFHNMDFIANTTTIIDMEKKLPTWMTIDHTTLGHHMYEINIMDEIDQMMKLHLWMELDHGPTKDCNCCKLCW